MRAALLPLRLCLCWAALLALPLGAKAADDAALDCRKAVTNSALNECAFRAYKRADEALNAAYKARMASLTPAQREQLRIQQRAWLKQRDPQCKEEVKDAEGGTAWTLEFHGCLTEATEARTQALKTWHPGP